MSIPALRLNHYFYEVPKETAAGLRRKEFMFKALEKISWVAFVAIMAAIFTVSYAGIAMAGNLPLVLAGVALLSPLLGLAASHLNTVAFRYAKRAEVEEGVANEFRTIADWRTPEIQQFLQTNDLNCDRIPLDALRQKNQDEPFLALLPLIARFNFFCRLQKSTETTSQENLASRNLEHFIEEDQRRLIRLVNRQIGWRQHEHEAIPRGFDAATMLQIMQNPIAELSLSNIGQFVAKTFEERQFDRIFEPRNDDYFRFHEQHKPPLSLAEVEQMGPRALRLRLYSPPDPARRQ